MADHTDQKARIDDLLRRGVRSASEQESPATKMWDALRKRIEDERGPADMGNELC